MPSSPYFAIVGARVRQALVLFLCVALCGPLVHSSAAAGASAPRPSDSGWGWQFITNTAGSLLTALFPQGQSEENPGAFVRDLRLCRRDFTLYIGETHTIVPVPVGDDRGPISGAEVTFSSNNPAVAEITSWGEINAIAPGVASVRVQAGPVHADVRVEVLDGARIPMSDQEWEARYGLACSDAPSGQTKKAAEQPEESMVAQKPVYAADEGDLSEGAEPSSAESSEEGYETGATVAEEPGSAITVSTSNSIDESGADPTAYDATSYENEVGSPRYGATENSVGSPIEARANLGSANYSFSAPVISLGGRESSVDLALVYNAQLWEKDVHPTTGAVTMNFNYSKGWPAPGWRLGYGRMIENYDDSATGDKSGSGQSNKPGNNLLVTADGTRIHMEQVWDATAGIYKHESRDGQYLKFNKVNGKLKYPNGTIVTYNTVVDNNRRLPVTIQSPNGNIVRIAYKVQSNASFPVRQAIQSITDTLERTIEFVYDETTGTLLSITAPAYNGAGRRTIVEFQYQTITFDYSFDPSYTIKAPADLSSLTVLRRIYYPDTGMGYLLTDYSSYGMIRRVSVRNQMRDALGAASDGAEIAYSHYNYYQSPSASEHPATPLTRAPRYDMRKEWWTGKTDDSTGLSTTATSDYGYSNTSSGGKQVYTVTHPTNVLTGEKLIEVTEAPEVDNPTSEEIKGRVSSYKLYKNLASGTPMREVRSRYVTAGGGPQRSSVTTLNQWGYGSKVVTSYDWQYARVGTVSEYNNFGDASPARVTDYEYLDAHPSTLESYTDTPQSTGNFLHLVKKVTVKTGAGALQSRTLYDYDMTARTTYGTPLSLTQTRNASYDTGISMRGNLTKTTRWVNTSGTVTTEDNQTYDVYGNLVSADVNCCNQQTYAYANGASGLYFAAPTSVTKGGQLTTSYTYDLNTGVVRTQTAPNGAVTSYGYDAAARPSSIILPAVTGQSASQTMGPDKDAYGNDLLAHKTTTSYTDFDALGNSTSRTITSKQWLDGGGRAVRAGEGAGSAPTSWSVVQTRYDAFGRPLTRSNPFASSNSSGTGSPQGWTTKQYDVLGRVTKVTLQDGSTVETFFGMPNSTTAELSRTTQSTDQVGRKRRFEVDGLGRTVKVFEQDPADGSIGDGVNEWVTETAYDVLDNPLSVKQYKPGSLSAYQERTASYDALGRVLTRTTPEGGTESYSYEPWGGIKEHTDARQVKTIFTYDPHNRIDLVQFDTSAAPGVPDPADIDFTYYTLGSGTGQLQSVTDYLDGATPKGTTYTYDTVGRIATVARQIDTRTYTYAYGYNGAGQVVTTTYPDGNGAAAGRVMRQHYDARGRQAGLLHDTTTDVNYVTGVSYNAAGQVTGLTLGNGTVESFTYSENSRLQLTGQSVTKSGATLMNLQYDWDAAGLESGAGTGAGNTSQLMGIKPGSVVGSVDAAQAFTYDTLGRLVTETGSNSQVLSAPSNLAATAASSSQINLTWGDTNAAETGYEVWRKTGAGGTYALVGTTAANATSYPSTGLAASTTYYYKVRATDGSSTSAYSAEVSATTPAAPACTAAPTAPSGITVTAVSFQKMKVTWADNAGTTNPETKFVVERSQGGGAFAAVLTTSPPSNNIPANTTLWEDTTVQGGLSYSYRVRAENTCGVSAWNTSAAVTTPVTDKAMSFDGTDDYARAADSVSLSVTGDLTVEAWIKPDIVTGTQAILSKRKTGTGTDLGGYELRLDGALVTFETYKNDGTVKSTITSNVGVAMGAWYHVAGVFDESGVSPNLTGVIAVTVTQAQKTGQTMTMTYKSASVAVGGAPDGGSPLQLGRTLTGGGTSANLYDGLIDEARVSNSPRYSVATSPSKTFTSDTNTKALWKMQDTAGADSAADSSANANTLTVTGPTYAAAGVTSTNKRTRRSRRSQAGREAIAGVLTETPTEGDASYAPGAPVGKVGIGPVAIGSTWQRRYVYDRWANRTAVYDAATGGTALQIVAMRDTNADGVPDNNRIQSVTDLSALSYSYDAAGNQTSDGTTNSTFDAAGRITSTTNAGGTSTYQYDDGNRRIKRVSGGSITHYVWEGSHVIAEYTSTTGASWTLSAEYLYAGARLVARVAGGATSYYHRDRLSTRLITNTSGAITGTMSNHAFGVESGSSVSESSKYHFTSYDRDTETGTDYALNRQYSPSTGRFARPDPLGGQIERPQSLNRYSYCMNDPINLVDPLGLQWKEQCWETSTEGVPGFNRECEWVWVHDAPRVVNDCTRMVEDLVVSSRPGVDATWAFEANLGRAFALRAKNDFRGNPPTRGFKPQLTAGGQEGGVYKHVYGHIGALLIGDNAIYYAFGQTGFERQAEEFALDIDQRDHPERHPGHSSEEAAAEVLDDLAAMRAATAIRQRIRGQITGEQLRGKLLNEFCGSQ